MTKSMQHDWTTAVDLKKQIYQPDGEHQIEHLDDMSRYLNKQSGVPTSTGSQAELDKDNSICTDGKINC